ncbi:WD repeat-containing protein 18-like isoform X2 [Marmota marmota marmota]|uniref:WD repeat-containing protein 18-like isoform X2 n=1 Tax=Marmota marmota marmota TaxID=9994 RepID=UPI002093C433|nr:WD repeat-containing protein 18-like isoform X2 [Marmota marmota marmota]
MAAPMEVAVCTDSAAQLWSCVVWELHSGANLLTYRGGQAGPRGLALLNGEYLLAAQLGKNYISAWELQRKMLRVLLCVPRTSSSKRSCALDLSPV